MKVAEQAPAFYPELLAEVRIEGIEGIETYGEMRQSAPCDLLAADDSMLVVPLAEASLRGVSINALGFSGPLLVKDRKQLEAIRTAGPMHVLRVLSGSARDHT